jgi:hypothetical protein
MTAVFQGGALYGNEGRGGRAREGWLSLTYVIPCHGVCDDDVNCAKLDIRFRVPWAWIDTKRISTRYSQSYTHDHLHTLTATVRGITYTQLIIAILHTNTLPYTGLAHNDASFTRLPIQR